MLVVVEDSIVRGTTTRQIIALLREAGATEVHFRVSSPPYRWPCFYGLDTGKRSDLLAADMSVGEIADYLGVDSLAYLDLDRLDRGDRLAARVVLHRVLHRRVSGAGPRVTTRSTRSRSSTVTLARARTPSMQRDARMTAREPERAARRYADAGVDIAAGEKAVELIKEHVRSTFRPRGRRRHRRLRRAVRGRLEAVPTTRCSSRPPTASAPSR